MDYPGGPSVILRILRGKQENELVGGGGTTEAEVRGMRLEAKKAGKDEKWIPLDLPEGTHIC